MKLDAHDVRLAVPARSFPPGFLDAPLLFGSQCKFDTLVVDPGNQSTLADLEAGSFLGLVVLDERHLEISKVFTRARRGVSQARGSIVSRSRPIASAQRSARLRRSPVTNSSIVSATARAVLGHLKLTHLGHQKLTHPA